MLQNVAALNVEFQNVKFLKHKRHITYSIIKRIPLQNVKCTLCKGYKTYVCFVTLYIMWRSRFDTFMFRMLTLCAAMLSNIHVRVQWFWLFFTFWGITTHPWHPKGPRIWKLAKNFFQLHAWPAEIFDKNRKMCFLVWFQSLILGAAFDRSLPFF